MKNIDQIVIDTELAIEGFLVTHPISKFAVHAKLREHLEETLEELRDRIFVLDYSTSIDLPEETKAYFKSMIAKYGADLLEQSMKVYLEKHRKEISFFLPNKNKEETK